MAITMKRFVYIMVALLTGVSAANAQNLTGVNIEGYTMERSGDYVVVDIDLDISQLEVKGKQSAVITPHIVRDSTSLALKSIGVYGRNRYFFYERNEELAPTSADDLEYRSNKLPEIVNYHAVVPYEEWMDGCKLVLERSDCGCGNVELGSEGSVLVDRFPLEPYIPTLLYIRPEAEGVKSRSVSGSAFIDFPVNKVDIRPSYRNNVAELAKITGTIDSIKADKDITITAISIKGFASPEGSYANNTRLAKGRTEALKQYVMNLYNFNEELISTSYEVEDWAGVERYVEASDIDYKEAILRIIRGNDAPDKKEAILRNRYSLSYQRLLQDCYPALRHSDYVVEYQVRQYSTPEEIERIMNTAPQNLSLEEFYILAKSYEPGSEQLNELWEIAVRMYPHDEIANFNAANSAMDKADFERAKRYLDKAGNRPEVNYSRGCIETLKQDYVAAIPYLEEAVKGGVKEAEPVLEALKNHWKVTQPKRK